MRRICALLLLVWFTAAALPVQAQAPAGITKAQRVEIERFAANNSLFVIYHELAHLLIDRFRLPVLGREEDAADSMASWALLNKDSGDANRTLADAAWGWVLTGAVYDDQMDDADYAAGHSLDRQRALRIVCLMVGRDAKAFRAIANQYALGTDRQRTCGDDYGLVDRSLTALLGAAREAGTAGTVVHITYHDAGPGLQWIANAFRSSGAFDTVAEDLRSNFTIGRAVKFNARRCDEANAYYDPDTLEIIFCYELMEEFALLYADRLNQPSPQQGGKTQKMLRAIPEPHSAAPIRERSRK